MEKQEGACAMEDDGLPIPVKEMEITTSKVMQEMGSATNTSILLDNTESVENRFSRKYKYKYTIMREVKSSPEPNFISRFELASQKVLEMVGPTENINNNIKCIDSFMETNYKTSVDSTEGPQHVYSGSCYGYEPKTKNILSKLLNYRKNDDFNEEKALHKGLPVNATIPFDETGSSKNFKVPSTRGGKYRPSFTTEKNHFDVQNTSLNTECLEQQKIDCFSKMLKPGTTHAVQSTSDINTNTGNTKPFNTSKPKKKNIKKNIDDKDLNSFGSCLEQKMFDLKKTIADIDLILAEEIKCKDKYIQKGYKFTHSVLTFLEKQGFEKQEEQNQQEKEHGEQ